MNNDRALWKRCDDFLQDHEPTANDLMGLIQAEVEARLARAEQERDAAVGAAIEEAATALDNADHLEECTRSACREGCPVENPGAFIRSLATQRNALERVRLEAHLDEMKYWHANCPICERGAWCAGKERIAEYESKLAALQAEAGK